MENLARRRKAGTRFFDPRTRLIARPNQMAPAMRNIVVHKHWKPEEYDRQAESLKKALESLRKEEHQLEKKLKKRGTAAKQRKMPTTKESGGQDY